MKPGDVIRAQLVFSNIPMAIKPDDYIPMRPIPITERLPKPYDPSSTHPQDCDLYGRCWWWDEEDLDWYMACHKIQMPGHTHWLRHTYWLPHWAIPRPEVEA